jgi:hypothetical protein
MGYVYAREVWFTLLRKTSMHQLVSRADSALVLWWLDSRKMFIKAERKGFDTFVSPDRVVDLERTQSLRRWSRRLGMLVVYGSLPGFVV